ncbi:MAG: NUDIX domain-containing protein [Candidatus Microgenomates bacterium]
MGKDTQNKVILTREFSSGGVVFKKEKGEALWLIRKTTSSDLYPKPYWMLPKGRIDDTEDDEPGPMASGKVRADEDSLQKAAIREVSEEGGIEAKIIKKIGTIKYSFTHPVRGKILKFATFYLMEWQKDLPEGYDDETSEVAWLPIYDAVKKLSFSGEKQVTRDAQKLLASLA